MIYRRMPAAKAVI